MITNAVPTNNGDAALVLGLYEKLKDRGYDVVISTMKYDLIKDMYPNVKWIKSELDLNKFEKAIFKIFPVIGKKYMDMQISKRKEYKDIDVIISAPGGYVNSYYGFEKKFYCMDLIKKKCDCKLIMYSQSVGPLNDKDIEVLERYINNFDLFMVRDQVSYDNVKKYNNVIKTNDAAFLLKEINADKNITNKVAISVREWGHDGRNELNYINLIRSIVIKCIENGNNVEFISTCQGIKNYVDDSKIAYKIKEELDDKYKPYVEVNNKVYSLNELRNYISNFKFVIGTRLHMCILSIISGIPAFNISYEVKGKECYNILNLNQYSIDYNDEINKSLEKIQEFIDDNESLKSIYLKKSKEMNKEANYFFEYMIKNIIERD